MPTPTPIVLIATLLIACATSADEPCRDVLAEAACGQCQFGLSGTGCDLAVRIDGVAYFVDGSDIDDHGDAHAADGLCNAIRPARVDGRVLDGRFVATRIALLPPAPAPGPTFRVTGTGFVTDDGHPEHPFQFHRHDITLRLSVHPGLGESVIEVESGTGDTRDIDRYFVRRGRIFQVDAEGTEIDPRSLGDLRPATVAALHPVIVDNAMSERAEMVREADTARLFAWNDELWTVASDGNGRLTELRRRTSHDRLGDGEEIVSYTGWGPHAVAGVIVTGEGRTLAQLSFDTIELDVPVECAAGNRRRDRTRVIAAEEIEVREVAPNLHVVDLASMNTRITIAEFADHLVVLEGAYNSRICDLVAAAVQERLGKPVRYFAFSHIHSQYIGGTRSWVHAGATILAPPRIAPLVEVVAGSQHGFRPDALAREPKPLRIEVLDGAWSHADELNSIAIHNIESDHTDDFLIFFFPRQKVLVVGDLLWYRPGRAFTGRSRKLCEAVETLGLDVDQFYLTWPLDDRYGTKDVVTRAEFDEGCAAAP